MPRRASIYKRKDGRWVGSVSLPDGRRKPYDGKTREEVAQKLTNGLKDVQDRLPIPLDQLKVGPYLQEWLQTVNPSLRPGTWTRYEQLLRLYAIPALGRLSIAKLNPQHVQRLYANCLARGLAPATVRQLHAVLRKAIGQAERWGRVSRNVVALTDPPRIPRHEITPLSQQQTRAFLEACQGDPFEALYVTAIGIGLRLGGTDGTTVARCRHRQ